MDRKNSLKHPEKVFYVFLCESGMIFQFLDLLRKTRFTSLKKHCERNKPQNYIINAKRWGTLTNKHHRMWEELDVKWLEHLKTKTK